MKPVYRYCSLLSLAMLLLSGCGGDGSSKNRGAALDSGGSGLVINQVDDGSGTAVTANFSAAMDINDNLEVIGFAEVAAGSPFVAALWTVNASGAAAVAPTTLASLTPGGFAAAFAIDQGGSPVGQAHDGNRPVAVIWKNGLGAPVVLPQLAGTGAYAAYAISDDGSLVVGEAADGSAIRAVIWTADGNGNFVNPPVPLPVNIFASGADLSRFSSASSVARAGAAEILVVGEAEAGNGTMHGALWRSIDAGASFAPVDLGAGYVALAVNGSRQIVGESVVSLSPVSWAVNAQGVPAAPASLATAGSAVAINDNGRIAGWSGASDRATVWNGTTPFTLFDTESQAYALNNDPLPLVVGRNGSHGFVKRAN